MFTKKSNSNKWIVLAISFMLMLTFAISLQSLPQIFDKIQGDISFSNSQAGMLMGAYAIPGIFLPFLIAFLASRYNKKSIIIITLLIMIAGLIAFSMSGAFSTLLTYRLVTGIGATALVVLAPLLVTMFFDKENMGIAMGIFNTAVPIGTVIATNLFGVLGQRIHWRSIILGIAAFVGIIIDKTGWRKRLLLVGGIIMATSFILISRGSLPLPLLGITLGIGFTPIPIFVFSSLPQVIKPHQMGMGLGILTAASNLGIAIGPSAFGFLLDKTGDNFNLGFMILASASLVIILALRGLKIQAN